MLDEGECCSGLDNKLLTKLPASWLRTTVADTGMVAFLGRTTHAYVIEVRVAFSLYRDHRERRLGRSGTAGHDVVNTSGSGQQLRIRTVAQEDVVLSG